MYLPAIIWIIGAAICYLLLYKKGAAITIWWHFLIVLLGPLAIPLVIFKKS